MEIPTSRTAAPFKSSDFDEIDWAVVAHLLHGVENLQGLQRLAPSHYSMPSENRESQEAMLQVASAEEGLVIAVSSALTWHSIRKCLNNVFSSAVLLVQTILVLSDHGPHEGETPQFRLLNELDASQLRAAKEKNWDEVRDYEKENHI